MDRSWVGLLVLLLLAPSARTADDPRALIRRAIDEMGGKDLLTRKAAVQLQIAAKAVADPKGGASIKLRGEVWRQVGGNALRMNMQIDVGGNNVRVNHVMNGDRSWQEIDGRPIALPNPRDALLAQQHQDRVSSLVPLLVDKGFTFTALPEEKVDGRPARGIKVSFKDRPDVHLYFDKASGLLVKYGSRIKVVGTDKMSLSEVILRDYRPMDGSADEQVLRSARVPTDAKGLLAFLKRQAPGAGELAKAQGLVGKLGDDEFNVREQAEKDLVALGPPALPFLRAAAKGGDIEVVRRAQRCLKAIEARTNPAITRAAVRLIALRNPAGTIDTLLSMLPSADEPVKDEVRAALADLAERDAKARAALSKVLLDRDAGRPAAAAEAVLGKDGRAYLNRPGRRMQLPGLRQAMKQVSVSDGVVTIELEIVEAHFFNRLDDKLFVKPGY